MAQFNRRLLVLVAPLLLAALAACGALIPDQSATDPFKLDGKTVEVAFTDVASASLTPQTVVGESTTTFEWDDFERSFPISPREIVNEVRVASAVLSGGADPGTIELTGLTIRLRAWQGPATYGAAEENQRAQITLTAAGPVVLRHTGSCTASGCPYTVQAGGQLGSLTMEGNALSNFLRIATNTPITNYAEIYATVESEDDNLAGTTLTIRLSAAEGTIKF